MLLVLCLVPQAAPSRYEVMYIAGGAGLVFAEDMNKGGPEVGLETGWMGNGEAPTDRPIVDESNRRVEVRYRDSRI